MTKHPADGVQGAFVIDDGGVPRRGAVGIHVHDDVGAGGLLSASGDVFARAGQRMLQAINRISLQIVGRGVDGSMAGSLGDLQIGAVLAGAAIQPALSHVQRRHRRIERLKGEALGGACSHAHNAGGGPVGIGIIRNGKPCRISNVGFRCQYAGGAVGRPFKGPVSEIIPVQVAHPVPPATLTVLKNFFHLNDGVPGKVTGPKLAGIALSKGFVHIRKGVGLRGDLRKSARLRRRRFLSGKRWSGYVGSGCRWFRRRLGRDAFGGVLRCGV